MIKKYAIYAGISAVLMLAACSPQPGGQLRSVVTTSDKAVTPRVRYVYDELAHKLVHVKMSDRI